MHLSLKSCASAGHCGLESNVRPQGRKLRSRPSSEPQYSYYTIALQNRNGGFELQIAVVRRIAQTPGGVFSRPSGPSAAPARPWGRPPPVRGPARGGPWALAQAGHLLGGKGACLRGGGCGMYRYPRLARQATSWGERGPTCAAGDVQYTYHNEASTLNKKIIQIRRCAHGCSA